MKNWKFTLLPVVAIALGMTITGCKKSGDDVSDDKVIKVGEFASLTGGEAAFGQSSHKGTQLAIDDINAAGGVLGKKLKLVYEDNQSKGSESATIVRKFISRDKVVAVLGEVASSRSLEAAPICQTNHIPMISPSSTNPKVTETGDYIFRVCFIDPFQGKMLANFAKDTLKAVRVAVLTDVGSSYSVGLATFFKDPFVANGGTIVAEQKYSGGDKDFKAQLTAIKAANPDAVFIPGYYTEAALIAQQARQLGITVTLFGGDGWEAPELLQIGGKAMEDTYYTTHYTAEDPSPLVQQFVKEFKAKYDGAVPDSMAALGYDSAMLLVTAMKKAGTTDGPKLRDAIIASAPEFVGVGGKTSDAKLNSAKSAVIVHVKDGKFNKLQTVSP